LPPSSILIVISHVFPDSVVFFFPPLRRDPFLFSLCALLPSANPPHSSGVAAALVIKPPYRHLFCPPSGPLPPHVRFSPTGFCPHTPSTCFSFFLFPLPPVTNCVCPLITSPSAAFWSLSRVQRCFPCLSTAEQPPIQPVLFHPTPKASAGPLPFVQVGFFPPDHGYGIPLELLFFPVIFLSTSSTN